MMLEIPPTPVGCMCVKARKEFGRIRTAHNLECNREDEVPYGCGDSDGVPAHFTLNITEPMAKHLQSYLKIKYLPIPSPQTLFLIHADKFT